MSDTRDPEENAKLRGAVVMTPQNNGFVKLWTFDGMKDVHLPWTAWFGDVVIEDGNGWRRPRDGDQIFNVILREHPPINIQQTIR